MSLFSSCSNQSKKEEVINQSELESQIIEQSFPLLVNKIVFQPYGFEPYDGETISNYVERHNKFKDEFKSKIEFTNPEIVISNQLFIPGKEDVTKYRKSIDWDLFSFLTSDSIEAKKVNILNLKNNKVNIIKSYPKNLKFENKDNLTFIGGCWYSRILFNKNYDGAKFIFFFDGGFWQSQEFMVMMKKSNKKWKLHSIKEI